MRLWNGPLTLAINGPTPDFALSADGEPDVYEKQAIYAGRNFVKHIPGQTPQNFDVTHDDIDWWNRTIPLMLSEGVEIPMPLDHSKSADVKRGEVVGCRVGLDTKGRYSLFIKSKFIDDEARRQHVHSNVSIYVPDYIVTGKGKRIDRPIAHVGLTNYPVIPGLEPFKPLALSLEDGQMNPLAKIAIALGLADTATEEEILAAIMRMKAPQQQPGMPPGGMPMRRPGGLPGPPPGLSQNTEGDEHVPPMISASLVTMVKRTRDRDIDQLVSEFRITKAVGDKLKAKWCTPEAATLALSMDDGADDGFEELIATLKLNEPSIGNGKGGKTGLQLSREGGGDGTLPKPTDYKRGESVLVKSAQKRAEAHNKRRGG